MRIASISNPLCPCSVEIAQFMKFALCLFHAGTSLADSLSKVTLAQYICPQPYKLGDGQSCAGLDKSLMSTSEEVRCYFIKLCCAQVTFCSDQAAPPDPRELPNPSSSPKGKPLQEKSDEKAENFALRAPAEPDPSADPISEDVMPARKRHPTTSVKAGDRTRSLSPNRRSVAKGRQNSPANQSTADFPARPTVRRKGRLWSEGDPIPIGNQAGN